MQRSKLNVWGSWAAIIVGALVAGVALPQMVPGETTFPKSTAVAPSAEKPDLSYSAPSLPDVSSPQPMLARLAAGTVFVLLLCVGSLYGVRQWLGPTTTNALPKTMRLTESLSLGNRCSLHLVQMGKSQVLVGTDGGGIKTIVPLASPFEEILAEEEKTV